MPRQVSVLDSISSLRQHGKNEVLYQQQQPMLPGSILEYSGFKKISIQEFDSEEGIKGMQQID